MKSQSDSCSAIYVVNIFEEREHMLFSCPRAEGRVLSWDRHILLKNIKFHFTLRVSEILPSSCGCTK